MIEEYDSETMSQRVKNLSAKAINLNLFGIEFLSQLYSEINEEEQIRLYKLNPAYKTNLSVKAQNKQQNQELNHVQIICAGIENMHCLFLIEKRLEEIMEEAELMEKVREDYIKSMLEAINVCANKDEMKGVVESKREAEIQKLITRLDDYITFYKNELAKIDDKINVLSSFQQQLSVEIEDLSIEIKEMVSEITGEFTLKQNYHYEIKLDDQLASMLNQKTYTLDVSASKIQDSLKNNLDKILGQQSGGAGVKANRLVRQILIAKMKTDFQTFPIQQQNKLVADIMRKPEITQCMLDIKRDIEKNIQESSAGLQKVQVKMQARNEKQEEHNEIRGQIRELKGEKSRLEKQISVIQEKKQMLENIDKEALSLDDNFFKDLNAALDTAMPVARVTNSNKKDVQVAGKVKNEQEAVGFAKNTPDNDKPQGPARR